MTGRDAIDGMGTSQDGLCGSGSKDWSQSARSEPAAASDQFPFVSVVIASYRRRDLLRSTISHILKDPYPWYEIIVVDQTEEELPADGVLGNLGKSGREVRYFHLAKANLSAARNLGIQQSRGEIILFCDDDIIPWPRWIQAHVRHYADPKIMSVAGGEVVSQESKVDLSLRRARWKRPLFRTLVLWQDIKSVFTRRAPGGRIGKRIVAQFTRSGAQLHDWTVSGTGIVDFGKGCNMSFRKAVFPQVGYFDPRCTHRDEADLFIRLKRKGLLVMYDSDAGVCHLKADSGGGWFRLPDPRSHYRWRFYCEAYFFLKNFPTIYFPLFLLRLLPEAFHSFRVLGFGSALVLTRSLMDARRAVKEIVKQGE